jgi:hypothetical protein
MKLPEHAHASQTTHAAAPTKTRRFAQCTQPLSNWTSFQMFGQWISAGGAAEADDSGQMKQNYSMLWAYSGRFAHMHH